MVKDSTTLLAERKKVGRIRKPAVLTIAGSDSGGGAGIQADLKTFAALGVHGTSAITCVTAQNPAGVRSVQAIAPERVVEQVKAVRDGFQPRVIKTGMLYSAGIIEAVLEALSEFGGMLIIDPVMIATSGAVLLKPSAISALRKRLLPRAFLATPNVHEAEHLIGRRIGSPEELREAARAFHAEFGCAALLKGGHLQRTTTAIDFFFDGKTELLLEAPFVRGVTTHGTGCTYSAAITAYCALGRTLPEAVIAAKEFISNAIASSYLSGDHFVLESFWR